MDRTTDILADPTATVLATPPSVATTVVDAAELEAARRDPTVKDTLTRASAAFERFESERRNL